jgi:hypothetical protein
LALAVPQDFRKRPMGQHRQLGRSFPQQVAVAVVAITRMVGMAARVAVVVVMREPLRLLVAQGHWAKVTTVANRHLRAVHGLAAAVVVRERLAATRKMEFLLATAATACPTPSRARPSLTQVVVAVAAPATPTAQAAMAAAAMAANYYL